MDWVDGSLPALVIEPSARIKIARPGFTAGSSFLIQQEMVETPENDRKADEGLGDEAPSEKIIGVESGYPPAKKVVPIMIALNLVILLIALDRLIIATAIPKMTDEFHSIGDIGWYGSSYLLTGCSFQLIFGKIYTLYSPKWVYIAAIVIFLLGSAVCGAAPTSTAFIIGRAIAGLGSAGAFSGAVTILIHLVPLRQRPTWTGLMGGMFGIASVAGPLLGGIFTDKVTWRWCFYINLPIGAVTLATVLVLLQIDMAKKQREDATLARKIMRLDPFGTLCFLPGMISLILALQWGGVTYAWNSARVISLLVLFVVLMIAFIAIQIWRQEDATVPPRIFMQRSVFGGICFTICVGASMLVAVYYLPLWFQAIKGVSAIKSGIMNLPLVLSMVIGVISSGAMVTVIGYYTPFMLGCCVLSAIGAGLLTTFTPATGHQQWIGYQVLFGFGLGIGMQQAVVATQTVLSRADVPIGSSLVLFGQQIGGAIFIAVAQNIFTNKLSAGIADIPGIDGTTNLVDIGATAIRTMVKDPETLSRVLQVYNDSLVDAFRVSLATACAIIIGASMMEWKSVKSEEKQ
ncbi:hypothetical protein FQN57_001347 [Myotisia sp. PD_48]|nr:hypothetical protein FQN57_001347 [Myotisia sp. PD_48]